MPKTLQVMRRPLTIPASMAIGVAAQDSKVTRGLSAGCSPARFLRRHHLGARDVQQSSSSHAPASRSQRRPLRDEFFVQPVTAVVAPPNLSAQKPAGNCAPRDDDCAQMPGRCRCGTLAQSNVEVDGYHRGLCFSRLAFMYGPYRTSWYHSSASRWQPRR
jgi:hypothetical protein